MDVFELLSVGDNSCAPLGSFRAGKSFRPAARQQSADDCPQSPYVHHDGVSHMPETGRCCPLNFQRHLNTEKHLYRNSLCLLDEETSFLDEVLLQATEGEIWQDYRKSTLEPENFPKQ